MKLPKANLITAINGGPGALRQMLKDNSKEEFNGYVKATMRAGLVPANGVIVLVQGKPIVAFFHHVDKQFGQEALPEIFKISCESSCVMKIYSFPKEVNDEITALVNDFANAKVDMDSFWNDVDAGRIRPGMFPETHVAPGSQAAAPAGQARTGVAGQGAMPAVPSPQPLSSGVRGILNEAGGDLKMVVGDGLDIVGENQGRTVDVQEVKKQLQDKEEAIRKEIDSKIEERAMLMQEEEQFLKMDENLQRVLKGKEDEIAERDRIISDLKAKQEGQPPSPASEADDRLLKERESLKQREAKLQEMERMFRRVLTNTEERLKSKEDELLAKEEELKRQVDERNKFLDDLRAREAKVKEIEIRMAGSDSSANIQKLYETELRLRKVEEELMAKRNALEAAERKMGEHESIKGEVKAVLGMMDILLGRLPQEHITTFAKSEAHATYKRVMDHFKAADAKGDPNVKGLLERAMAIAPVPSGVPPPPPWPGEKVTEAEVRKTGADVDALVKAQEINEKRLREMDAALKMKESKLQESKDRINGLEDKARQFVDERKALLHDSEEMRKAIKQMESLESKAKMMEDELEGLREKARTLESREKELLREKEDMDIQLKRLQEESATEEEMEGLERAEEELRKEVDELKAKEAETRTREADLKAQLDSKVKELAESEKTMGELEDEVEEKVAAISGLKNELKGKPALEADAKRLEDELVRTKAEMTKASDAEKSLRDEIEKKAEQVKALETRLGEELKAGAAADAGAGAAAAGGMLEGQPPADEELLKMLKILDELLGKLPEDVVEEFVKTAHYELYERLFEKYKL